MSLLEVLSHENRDIACDAVEVLKEMTGAVDSLPIRRRSLLTV